MAMTVVRRKESRLPRIFEHKVADIRGGVSVATADLGSDYVHEGTALSAPINGICHVIKTAQVTAVVQDSEKVVKVKKGHHFNVGDVVLISEGAKAVKIEKIDKSEKTIDTVTLKETLGKIEIGESIVEAKAEAGSDTSALKYIPLSVVGTGKAVESNSNINTDAWLIGTTKGNNLPKVVADYLKGIINF